jgi:hypothetical protein
MELKECNLFSSRDTIDEAVEYFEDVMKAMPEQDRLPIMTGFYVFWNTIANNYTLTERETK